MENKPKMSLGEWHSTLNPTHQKNFALWIQGSQYSSKSSKEKLQIATYNIRTMRTQEHLTDLNAINWELLGQCKTRPPGENCRTL